MCPKASRLDGLLGSCYSTCQLVSIFGTWGELLLEGKHAHWVVMTISRFGPLLSLPYALDRLQVYLTQICMRESASAKRAQAEG